MSANIVRLIEEKFISNFQTYSSEIIYGANHHRGDTDVLCCKPTLKKNYFDKKKAQYAPIESLEIYDESVACGLDFTINPFTSRGTS